MSIHRVIYIPKVTYKNTDLLKRAIDTANVICNITDLLKCVIYMSNGCNKQTDLQAKCNLQHRSTIRAIYMSSVIDNNKDLLKRVVNEYDVQECTLHTSVELRV